MLGIGTAEFIVIMIVVLIAIGPRQFPEIARTLGRKYRQLEKQFQEIQKNLNLTIEQEKDEGRKNPTEEPPSTPSNINNDLPRTP